MDTHIKRYETFEELYIYCYRVASTVGLMSSEILGYSEKIALQYAEKLGIGMQLTKFCVMSKKMRRGAEFICRLKICENLMCRNSKFSKVNLTKISAK